MATVALLVHPARPEAARLAAQAVSWLETQGHQSRLLAMDVEGAATERPDALGAVGLEGADLAVSLGGDGTFLRLIAPAFAAGVPVMGVNFGRLGYLLEVAPDRFLAALARAVVGDVTFEERSVLSVHVPQMGAGHWVALNEVAVEKAVPGHMVSLTTAIDGERCFSYKADGVLVATPTGSTAYNLSAGGPIVSPSMRAMILTPVAPHLSIDRSLVVHPDNELTVEVLEVRPAVLVIDGREIGRLSPGDKVICRVAPEPIRFVSLGVRGFAGLLRSTLAPGRDG